MKITDALMGEHAVFYAQLDHLAGAVRGDAAPRDAAADASLLGSALEGHARLEEDLLFAPMEPSLGGVGGPLEVLRAEHEEIEALLTRARRADELGVASRAIRDLVELARAHFAREEEALFPAAEALLDEQRLLSLGASWAERRFSGATAAQRAAAGR